MDKKIALQGFDRLTLFPVLKNNATEYEVGAGFKLTGAQEMTRDNDVSEQKFYADDGLYLNVKQFNAMSTTITVLEMPLETLEKLGFGTFDTVRNEFIADPQGKNLEFAVSFRCLNTAGEYRMYKFFCFTVTEVKESSVKTKGKDVSISSYKLTGDFTKRKVDDRMYVIKDGAGEDSAWLDVVE